MLRKRKLGAVVSLHKNSPADVPEVAEEADFLRSKGIEFRQMPTDTPPSPEQVRTFLEQLKFAYLI